MKNLFFLSLLASALFCFTACSGDDDQLDPAAQLTQDLADIEAYLAAEGLTAQSTASGLYYIIEEEGTGAIPATSDLITVNFSGYYLDKKVFDETPLYPVTFLLSNAIDGWQEGLQLFKRGSKGKLFMPSVLGFGPSPTNGLRKNAPLGFDIELVQNLDSVEQVRIQAYLDAKGLTAQTTATGLRYTIEQEGDGQHPTSNAQVTVKYTGYYLDDVVFDGTTNGGSVNFSLNGVIPGWKEGIPKFDRGGKGKLFIPSKLAYGTNPPTNIPQNAILIFDIELVSF